MMRGWVDSRVLRRAESELAAAAPAPAAAEAIVQVAASVLVTCCHGALLSRLLLRPSSPAAL